MVIAGANRPRRRHGRHNPAVLGLLRGPFDVMKGMPQLLTGAIGGITASIVPSFVPMAADNRFIRYGLEGAVAIVGGTVVARFLGRQHGIAWTVGGMTILLIEVLKNEVMSRIPYFQGLSDYTVIQDYTVEGNNEIEAFPGDGMTVGAFPSMMTSPY